MYLEATVGKFKVKVIPDDAYIGPALLRGAEWDGWMRQDLAKFVLPGTEIIDVGGNIGWNALMFSDYAPVHTFEPVFFSLIDENVKINSLENDVNIHCYGLSDKAGIFPIFIPQRDANSRVNYGGCSLSQTEAHQGGLQQVELRRLDDVYTGRVSFMKIDVEGHELAVLKGAEQTIRKWKPVICIEIFNFQTNPVVDFLKSLGYNMIVPRPEHNWLCVNGTPPCG
jgi:FkbM family methyltransferase